MIDEILARHIEESFEDISLFLKLVSESILHHKHSLLVNMAHKDLIQVYETSGLLQIINYSKDEIQVKLREQDRWFAQLPQLPSISKKEKKEYVPQHLEELAEMLGYPVDWEKNKGKYMKNYFRTLKKYGKTTVDLVAKHTKKNNPELDLNVFLSEKAFNSLKYKQETPKAPKNVDRVDAADYWEDQAF